MKLIPGQPVKLTKWIHGRLCVVKVVVDGLVPDAEPSQPYLEPAAITLLDELQRRADLGDVDFLAKHGEVYVRRTA